MWSQLRVDCIDCAADSSVVNAVNEGIEAAREIVPLRKPWVMISINDDEDLHFRKAEFDPEECPADCSRPCEMVCPANAISLKKGGVIKERCYGCGRCFPICPYDNIRGHSYIRDASSTCQLLEQDVVDAIEIHTRARHVDPFYKLWNILAESISHVKLVALSRCRRFNCISNAYDVLNNEGASTLLQFMAVGWPAHEWRHWPRCNKGGNCLRSSYGRC
eukprot:TRINITY_DN14889_c0_g1_i3.p1 TRINITY_DN14889_c0_g1~~TRINITY_DN14889_c0_g1_i3.p1  ORF type:complete len:219 (+),score=39.00 TRINITY_DN14889_c0_g1_i3:250-906(+)